MIIQGLEFFEESLGLIPLPKRIELTDTHWEWNPVWERFSGEHDGGCYEVWCVSGDEVPELLGMISLSQERLGEAYAAGFFEEGVVGRAWAREGLQAFGQTLAQMRALAEGGPDLPRGARIEDWPDLGIRGIHLDLKYFLHSPGYLEQWLEEARGWKLNTLLIEYEDKFPYETHPEVRSPLALDRRDLERLLSKARGLGFRVIPHFPCLGHLEFVLKEAKFESLRAGPDHEYVTEIVAGDPDGLQLVFDLIDDILELHSEDEWFHIGGDEPWFIKRLAQKEPDGAAALYNRHILAVCERLIGIGKRPLLYDDLYRALPREFRLKYLAELPEQVILCVWDYSNKLSWPGDVLRDAFEDYLALNRSILGLPCYNWGSSLPFYRDHTIPNTLQMIDFVANHRCLGIINTGWACFHVPLPLCQLGVAITGARSWTVSNRGNARATEAAFAKLWFGVGCRRILDLMIHLAKRMEVATTFGRPLTLPHFFYMDAVLQYGDQEERYRLGSALDLYQNADYPLIAERRLEILRSSPQVAGIVAALKHYQVESLSAEDQLCGMRDEVLRGHADLELLIWTARFKAHACGRLVALLTDDEGLINELLAESDELKHQMRSLFSKFLIPAELDLELESLFVGEEALLNRGVSLSQCEVELQSA